MVAQRQRLPKANPNHSLGNDRKIGVPLPEIPPAPDDETSIEYRFRLQRAARSCWGNYDNRLMGCCVRQHPLAANVEVVHDPVNNSAHFRGLEQCSRVWTCPVCAMRITRERRRELTFALAAAKQKGWTPVLVTYTLRHEYRDLLQALLLALQAAVRDFKSGRAFQDIKAEWGIQGGIKALEVTFGENGWHPHIHEIIFLDVDRAKVNVAAFKQVLADRWLHALQKQGMDATFEHGLDVRTADSEIADYVAKWGHLPKEISGGVEHEVAGAPTKKAHRDGLTPFQLLEAVSGGDARARVLFQEYAKVMEGKRQLVWSPGLRALLEMPDELPDEQLPLFEEAEQQYTIITINPDEWQRCAIYELQPRILELASMGATAALHELFRRRDIWVQIHQPPDDMLDDPQIDELAAGPEIYAPATIEQPRLSGFEAGVRYD